MSEIKVVNVGDGSWYKKVYDAPVYEVILGLTSRSPWHVQLTPAGDSVVVIGGGMAWRTQEGDAAKTAYGIPIDEAAESTFGQANRQTGDWSSWEPGADWRGEIAQAVQTFAGLTNRR